MTTQNNLSLFTGDGPVAINFQVLQDGLPMNLTQVSSVIIALKGGVDQPDPVNPSANLFTQSNGIVLTSLTLGLGTLTLPASFISEPAIYWWHGSIIVSGAVFTWGFGVITVVAV
jgi:hypothetical protein